MFKILLLAICFAISFYISTALATYYSPLLMIGLRGLIAGSILLAMHYFSKTASQINLIKYKYQYLSAITLGFVVPFIFSAFILDKLPIVDLAVIATLEPIATYFVATLFFKEQLNKQQLFYLFLGTVFAFLAVIIEAGIDRISLISWHELVAILAVIVLAVGWIKIGKLTKLNEPEDSITGLGLVSTGIIATLLAYPLNHHRFTIAIVPLVMFFLTIFFGDLIVNRMRVRLTKTHSKTLLSLICIFSPFIIALHEELFHHRHYSYKFFLLAIPSIFCFMAFYRAETKNRSNQPSQK